MEGIKEKRGHSAAEPQPQRASVGVSAYRCIGVSVYRRKDNNSPLSNLQNLAHENLRKKNKIFTYSSTRLFPDCAGKKKVLLRRTAQGEGKVFVSHLATNMLVLVGFTNREKCH